MIKSRLVAALPQVIIPLYVKSPLYKIYTIDLGFFVIRYNDIFFTLYHLPILIVFSLIATTCIAFIPLIIYFRYKKMLEAPYVILEVKPLRKTEQSALSTKQLFTMIHSLERQSTFVKRLLNVKRTISCEIVSSKDEGIRYVLRVPKDDVEIIKKQLIAYLPGVEVRELEKDFLPQTQEEFKKRSGDIKFKQMEFSLSGSSFIPLYEQNTLAEHDPIAYITTHMTNLGKRDFVLFQAVCTPVLTDTHSRLTSRMRKIRYMAHKRIDFSGELYYSAPLIILMFFARLFDAAMRLILTIFFMFTDFIMSFDGYKSKSPPNHELTKKREPKRIEDLGPLKQDLLKSISSKIDQNLFEVSLRLFIAAKQNGDEINSRIRGIKSSFETFSSGYQRIITKGQLPLLSNLKILKNFSYLNLKNRLLAPSGNSILSVNELSTLYHFPFTPTTKTEDIVKVHSQELPAPLALKNANGLLDGIFGKNTYGGETTNIGLTREDREKHVFIIGQTGSGKSTIIFHMAKCDIQTGGGLAVFDPHGDLAEDLISTIPKEREGDFIYFNPFDLGHPIGINILEIPKGLSDDELELEHESATEGVVSIFRRVFSQEESTNAHRIEYMLRNTIYTAFGTVDTPTIFTIYDLLNNPDFRKQAISRLTDPNLKNFWKYEFGRAGNYQVVKMVSGVTAKVGRFLFSPIARRILEQNSSTINFDEILDTGKILICNLAEGKLGEDTSQLLGMTVLAKIQQAVQRRARQDKSQRRPFHLYVDEFQNFATSSFTRMLSGGRKFGLTVTIAEQSTAQQRDKTITNTILANCGTVICFRTASPQDAFFMSPQFEPYISREALSSLPRYRFFIKLSAVSPEEPFSGHTFPVDIEKDQAKLQRLIEASRKNYAISYQKPKIKVYVPSAKKHNTRTSSNGNGKSKKPQDPQIKDDQSRTVGSLT